MTLQNVVSPVHKDMAQQSKIFDGSSLISSQFVSRAEDLCSMLIAVLLMEVALMAMSFHNNLTTHYVAP